ncbi:MAG: alpha/beta fold hydrolase [Saprospiraceae bacterium]
MKYLPTLLSFFVFFIIACDPPLEKPIEKKETTTPTKKQLDNKFTSFDKVNIAYTDEGEGEPVILLHGFISSGNSWNRSALKKDLLEKGFRVIVPDLRGNGKSDQPNNPNAYANDAEIKDLKKLADHLNLEKYIAVGYSRGSIVLAKLLTQESRIKKAIIGGMGLDFSNPNWGRRIMFAEAFGGKKPLNEITKGAVEYATSINANLQVLSWLQEFQPTTSIEELEKIKTKILVIAGDEDTDNGNPSDLQKHLSNSKLKIIKGDHNNTYKAENFSIAVMNFILDKK